MSFEQAVKQLPYTELKQFIIKHIKSVEEVEDYTMQDWYHYITLLTQNKPVSSFYKPYILLTIYPSMLSSPEEFESVVNDLSLIVLKYREKFPVVINPEEFQQRKNV